MSAVIAGWAIAYLALPVWMIGDGPARNLAVLAGLVAYFAIAALLLRRMNLLAWPRLELRLPSLPRIWPLVALPWLIIQIVAQWGHALEMGYGDEELHAGVPAKLYDLLTWRTGSDLAAWWQAGALVILAVVVALLIRRPAWRVSSRRTWLLAPAGLLAYAALYQWLFAGLPSAGADLHRYPPLDPALRLLSITLFGANELALRLPGLLLALVAAWYVYRLVEMTLEREEAGVFAAVVLLYTPIFMHWSLQVYLVSGQAAFAAAIMYYLSRHLREGDGHAAAWAFYLAGLAVLYERMMVVVAPLLLVTVLIWGFQEGPPRSALRQRSRDYLKLSTLSLLTMLPWLVVTKLLGVRPPLICPRNWLDLHLVLAYPERLLNDLTLPLALLVTLGMVLAVIHLGRGRAPGRLPWAALFSLLWCGTLYVVYTSDAPEWIPTSRFLIVLLPAWAYLAAMTVDRLGRGKGSTRYWGAWTVVIGAWLVLSWVRPIGQIREPALGIEPGQDLTRWRQVNQPVDAAFRQLAATRALDRHNVLDLTYCSTAPFYCAKHRLRPQRLVRYSWYEHRGKYWQGPADIAALARGHGCDLVMFALPACLEPYPGVRDATKALRDLGRSPDPLFTPLASVRTAHGGYHVLRLEERGAR